MLAIPSWLNTIFYIVVVIVTLSGFYKLIKNIGKKVIIKKEKIRNILKEKIPIPVWFLSLIGIILLIYLLIPIISFYIPEKEKIYISEETYFNINKEVLEDTISVSYYGSIELSEITKSEKLICIIPPELNITNQIEGKKTKIDGQDAYIWENPTNKIISLKGDLKMPLPFSITNSFNPPIISEDQSSILNLNIFRNGEFNKKHPEYISLNFDLKKGISVEPLSLDFKKRLEPYSITFYKRIDLDKEATNSFRFRVNTKESIKPYLEILYINNILNCKMEGYEIESTSSSIFYKTLELLNVSS